MASSPKRVIAMVVAAGAFLASPAVGAERPIAHDAQVAQPPGAHGTRQEVTFAAAKKTTPKKVSKTAKKKPVAKRPTAPKPAVSTPTSTAPLQPDGTNTVGPATVSSLPVTASTVVSVTTTPPTPAIVIDPIAFSSCSDSNLECASVRVPRDYARPDGERITLFVSRRAARVRDRRLGVLLVNPGGPGAPSYDLVRASGTFLSPEVLDRFDVIGVDPRGTQRSAPLACRLPRRLSGTQDADAAVKELYQGFAASCGNLEGANLDGLDTETAARDLDAVRVALGEERISFLGMSYGTYLGAVYRSLFPTRVRAMILDSGVDPARFGANLLLDPLVARERAFTAFLDECASGRLNPCNFNDGTDLRAKYQRVREAYVSRGSSRQRREEAFDFAVADLVGYPRNGWPILGRALEEVARTGTGDFEATAADNLASGEEGESIVPLDRFSSATNVAIICRDGFFPRDEAAVGEIRSRAQVVAPTFPGIGATSARTAFTCINWPSAPKTLVPLANSQLAPTVVIGNTYDPTTPFAWSEALAATLAAPLVVRNGGGHVAINKSACVREIGTRFLVDGTTPTNGTVCSPSLSNPS